MNYRWRLEWTAPLGWRSICGVRRKLEQFLSVGLMYDYGSDEVTVYDEVFCIEQWSMVHLFGLCKQGNSKNASWKQFSIYRRQVVTISEGLKIGRLKSRRKFGCIHYGSIQRTFKPRSAVYSSEASIVQCLSVDVQLHLQGIFLRFVQTMREATTYHTIHL
jgi:hypothetical protein